MTTHVVVVGQGLTGRGGVPSVARWLVSRLDADPDFTWEVADLASSATDRDSRRIASPRSWGKRTLAARRDSGWTHFGANLVEWEPSRYLPRRELTALLRKADVVQVVAGGPALGNACFGAGRPVVIQAATLVAWERASQEVTMRSRVRKTQQFAVSWLERRALKRATAVLVENTQMAAFAQSLGQQRVVLAPPGIDCETFSPSGSWAASGPLLSVCRLADGRKGLERLITSYALLRERSFPLTPPLILAGSGPLPDRLRDLIDQLGLKQHVTVLQDVEQEALPALFRSSSCFVQTSYEEGLGLSSIEAMACGVPVVASSTAGSEQVVEPNVTGFLVGEGDDFDRRFADAIEALLAGPGEQMAIAARLRAVALFSETTTFATYRGAYRALHNPG